MSGMVIKFTSLAQIEAHQFVPADDSLCLQEAAGFVSDNRYHPGPRATIGSGGVSVGSGGCGTGKSGVGIGSGVSPGGGAS